MATAALPQPDHKRYPVGVGAFMTRRDNCVCDECLSRRYRKAILAGWEWLREKKLDHLLSDPWYDKEVVAYVDQFYHNGWKRFCADKKVKMYD